MRRRLSIVASTLLVAMTTSVLVGGTAGAQVAAGQPAQADYKGYSTGSVVHVDAVQTAPTGPRLVDTEVAFSGATVASRGTGGVTQGPNAAAGQVVNEMDQVVQPALPNTALDPDLRGDRSYARGSGLELGLANNLPAEAHQVVLAGRAQTSAPPTSDVVRKEVGPVKLNPVAYASLLRGQAVSRWDDSTCILGEPISAGLGYAADVQLLNTGADTPEAFEAPVIATDAPSPERRVSQSLSVTRLVPNVDGAGAPTGTFGLMTETRMTIAPITLFRGQPNQTTIEFAGEWVLRSVATGLPTGSQVFYGPGTVSPETPVVRIINAAGEVQNILTTQDLTGLLPIPPGGNAGANITVPGVAEISVGEDPRAIGGDHTTSPTVTPTEASGAVDVVRIKLLEAAGGGSGGGAVLPSALDLRIGHMESRAQVPAGGIACAIPVSKTSDKASVTAGEQFTYTITVTNPYADCDLTNVRLVDTITVDPGVRYSVVGTNPAADEIGANRIVFNDIGPIGPKASRSVTISIAVSPDSRGGLFTNNAVATGVCATGTAQGSARISVPLAGQVTIQAPRNVAVLAGGLPATGVTDVLPRTGADQPALLLAGLGLLAAAALARRARTAAGR